jgi:hypothetical protein
VEGVRAVVLTVKDIADECKTSVRSVYRMFADGLEFLDLPGGYKVEEAAWEAYKKGRKKCLSGRTNKDATTLPSSEGEHEFIESARRRRRGGTRSARKPNSSSVSMLPAQERS